MAPAAFAAAPVAGPCGTEAVTVQCAERVAGNLLTPGDYQLLNAAIGLAEQEAQFAEAYAGSAAAGALADAAAGAAKAEAEAAYVQAVLTSVKGQATALAAAEITAVLGYEQVVYQTAIQLTQTLQAEVGAVAAGALGTVGSLGASLLAEAQALDSEVQGIVTSGDPVGTAAGDVGDTSGALSYSQFLQNPVTPVAGLQGPAFAAELAQVKGTATGTEGSTVGSSVSVPDPSLSTAPISSADGGATGPSVSTSPAMLADALTTTAASTASNSGAATPPPISASYYITGANYQHCACSNGDGQYTQEPLYQAALKEPNPPAGTTDQFTLQFGSPASATTVSNYGATNSPIGDSLGLVGDFAYGLENSYKQHPNIATAELDATTNDAGGSASVTSAFASNMYIDMREGDSSDAAYINYLNYYNSNHNVNLTFSISGGNDIETGFSNGTPAVGTAFTNAWNTKFANGDPNDAGNGPQTAYLPLVLDLAVNGGGCRTASCWTTAEDNGWSASQEYQIMWGQAADYPSPQMYNKAWAGYYADIDSAAKAKSLSMPEYTGLLYGCGTQGNETSANNAWQDFYKATGEQTPTLTTLHSDGAYNTGTTCSAKSTG